MRPHHTRSAGTATFVFHPSYANPTTITEGTTTTYYIQTTGVSNGTTLYWNITHGTTTNADFSVNSNSFTVNNNFGQFGIFPTDDGINDGGETFTLNIRTESTSGPVVLSRNIILNNAPIFATITGPDDLTEGQYYTYAVTTTGIANNSYVYVMLQNVSTSSSDVNIYGWNGIYIYNGSGTFQIYVEKNDGYDTPESFYMYIQFNNQTISDYTYRQISYDLEDPMWSPINVYAIKQGCIVPCFFIIVNCFYNIRVHCNIPPSYLNLYTPSCDYQQLEQHRDEPQRIRVLTDTNDNYNKNLIVFGWFDGTNWIPSLGHNNTLECHNKYMTIYDNQYYYLNVETCCQYPDNWSCGDC